jgi:hypothetical protein
MIQNVLEKVLNTLNDGKALQIHDNINDELLQYQDKGWIDDDERDALRHYYTIQGLAHEYGETIAWISGLIHEDLGLQLLHPEESAEYKSTKADLNNNNMALEMYKLLPEGKNPLQDLYLADSPERLKAPLAFLEIIDLVEIISGPDSNQDIAFPPNRDILDPPPRSQSNSGYHPELDQNQ